MKLKYIYYYIYITENKVNGKTYIGQRHCNCEPKLDDYLGSGIYLNRSIKKYGKENFEKKILAICDNQKTLNVLEKNFIKYYRSIGKAEYNISDGGDGGNHGELVNKKISEQVKKVWQREGYREKIKKSLMNSEKMKNRQSPNKGKKLSEEHKRKISEAHKGKPGHQFSEEVKIRISQKLKGHEVSNETRQKISESTRIKMNSDEVKEKIKMSAIKRFKNPEERRKLSEVHKGKKLSEEHKRKISETLKRRYQK